MASPATGLELFKKKSDHNLDNTKNELEADFILTFTSPMAFDVVKEKIHSNDEDIKVSGVYTRSIGSSGDIQTGIAFGLDEKIMDEMKKQKDSSFKGIIQIEGKAKASIFKELQKDKDVYAVEISTLDYAPMGLYWRLEHANK